MEGGVTSNIVSKQQKTESEKLLALCFSILLPKEWSHFVDIASACISEPSILGKRYPLRTIVLEKFFQKQNQYDPKDDMSIKSALMSPSTPLGSLRTKS